MSRRLAWFSCGAASAVATKLSRPDVIAYCDTGSEHPDNERFLADCEKWFGQPIVRLKSKEYPDTWAVWEDRSYLAGIDGAPCTGALKIAPRLAFQKPYDVHIFGYTADADDAKRAVRFRLNWPEMSVETPLIEQGITKAGCISLIERAGIKPPAAYALGFPNNNCIPCVKATSPDYWALVRKTHPVQFERMAKLSRSLDVRLTRIKGERSFIDEIPADWPVTQPIVPTCDFLCGLAEMGLNKEVA